jgi:hypothetical protein
LALPSDKKGAVLFGPRRFFEVQKDMKKAGLVTSARLF